MIYLEEVRPYQDLATDAIKRWLANHQACIDAGLNVGLIDRRKAAAFRREMCLR